MKSKKSAKKSASKKINLSTAHKSTKPSKKAPAKQTISADAKIIKLVKTNPRIEGTFGHKSFSLIKNGMTVAQYQSKGGRRKDLHWDLSHGFVQVA